jgi:predicted ATPase
MVACRTGKLSAVSGQLLATAPRETRMEQARDPSAVAPNAIQNHPCKPLEKNGVSDERLACRLDSMFETMAAVTRYATELKRMLAALLQKLIAES